MSFKKSEQLAEKKIKENGFDINLWNDFLKNKNNFKRFFNKLLDVKSKNFTKGYKSY